MSKIYEALENVMREMEAAEDADSLWQILEDDSDSSRHEARRSQQAANERRIESPGLEKIAAVGTADSNAGASRPHAGYSSPAGNAPESAADDEQGKLGRLFRFIGGPIVPSDLFG